MAERIRAVSFDNPQKELFLDRDEGQSWRGNAGPFYDPDGSPYDWHIERLHRDTSGNWFLLHEIFKTNDDDTFDMEVAPEQRHYYRFKASDSREAAQWFWHYGIEQETIPADVLQLMQEARDGTLPMAAQSPEERRNELCYRRALEGVPYRHIMTEANSLVTENGWGPLTTVQGVKYAVSKHADDNHLDQLPKRTPGRPKK